MYDIEKLREAVDIEDVCDYLGIAAVKRGKYYYIPCPEHSEKVHDNCILSEGHYHCFSCGARGDIFSLVQHSFNISFFEAVKTVAQMTGNEEAYRSDSKQSFENSVLSKDDRDFLGICCSPVYALYSISLEEEGDFSSVLYDDRERFDLHLNFKRITNNPLTTLKQHSYGEYKSLVRKKAKDKLQELSRYKRTLEKSELTPDVKEEMLKLVDKDIYRAKDLFVSHGGQYRTSKKGLLANAATKTGDTLF